jgi:hypothetical protein
MKHLNILLVIFVMLVSEFLTACAPGGSASGNSNCSAKGSLCITVSTDSDPKFAVRYRVTLKILVTSQNNLPETFVVLHLNGGVILDGPQSWENYLSHSSYDQGLVTWNFPIKAGQTLTFNRVVRFPKEDGSYNITVTVGTPVEPMAGSDSFDVFVLGESGSIIRAGTPIPLHTPKDNSGVYGPGTPVPTYCCAANTPLQVPTSTEIIPAPTPGSSLAPYPGPTPYP